MSAAGLSADSSPSGFTKNKPCRQRQPGELIQQLTKARTCSLSECSKAVCGAKADALEPLPPLCGTRSLPHLRSVCPWSLPVPTREASVPARFPEFPHAWLSTCPQTWLFSRELLQAHQVGAIPWDPLRCALALNTRLVNVTAHWVMTPQPRELRSVQHPSPLFCLLHAGKLRPCSHRVP